MDLMTGTVGDVLLFSGDMSWLREMQISILFATLDGRTVQILCDPRKSLSMEDQMIDIARALGANVSIARNAFDLRGTLVAPTSPVGAGICIERRPSPHGLLLQTPHETGILQGLASLFNGLWNSSQSARGRKPSVRVVSPDAMIDALVQGVPAYRRSAITYRSVELASLRRLPKTLERFKLFRLSQLRALQLHHAIPPAAIIEGSPWPIKPPVVEIWQNQFVVVDGAHRAYSAYQRGEKSIEVLIVENPGQPLPAQPFLGWDVGITTAKLERAARYEQFQPEYFRPIRKALNRLAQLK